MKKLAKSGVQRSRERLQMIEDGFVIGDLLTEHFVEAYTDFDSVAEFLVAAGTASPEELGKPQYAEFISRTTKFDNWPAFVKAAVARYLSEN